MSSLGGYDALETFPSVFHNHSRGNQMITPVNSNSNTNNNNNNNNILLHTEPIISVVTMAT